MEKMLLGVGCKVNMKEWSEFPACLEKIEKEQASL